MSMNDNRITVTDEIVNRVVVTEEQQNVIRVLTAGLPGPAGTQIITGTGVPSNSIGRIGDFFFNEELGFLYGPKTASGWGTNYIPLSASSPLNDLSDVDTVGKADQEVLMYEESTETWVSQKIRHRHDQGTPSATWTISHGLKTKPAAVAVFDTSNTMVFGDVDHTNENNLVITFSLPFAGVAYLT
jgi:hypothetical protein